VAKKKMIQKKRPGRGRRPNVVEGLRENPERDTNIEIFMQLMIAEYLVGKEGEVLSNDEKAKRRKILAKHLGRTEQTLKNMYLYGQGSLQQFFKAAEFILKINQEEVIKFLRAYPYIMNKLDTLSESKKKLYYNMEQMTEEELALTNDLIEFGLQRNKVMREGKKDLNIK